MQSEPIWVDLHPREIHYHTYAGKDFTDRQPIKRTDERWTARYRKLHAGERQAVMVAPFSHSWLTFERSQNKQLRPTEHCLLKLVPVSVRRAESRYTVQRIHHKHRRQAQQ